MKKEFKDFGYKPDLRKRSWKIPKGEFKLSDKRKEVWYSKDSITYSYSEEDVKEFIKRRAEDLENIRFWKITSSQALNKLRKEAGNNLIKDNKQLNEKERAK
jgi:hypothetical protein